MFTTVAEISRRINIGCHTCQNLYEVLPSGWPCHIFFDLEYSKLLHQRTREFDDLAVIDIISATSEVIAKYNQKLDFTTIVLLDASNEKKFSSHLILPIKDGIWTDIATVKAIVIDVFHLLSSKDKLAAKCMIDLHPYSRNQQFRTVFSTKLGEDRPLIPISVPSVNLNFACFTKETMQCREFMSTLLSRNPVAIAPHINLCSIHHKSTCSVEAHACSPFPLLDKWISKEFECKIYKVRLDKLNPLSPSLYFHVSSTFCLNINRNHKSNHVIVVVDCQKFLYHQECFDPVCTNFKSVPKRVPVDLFFQMVQSTNFHEWVGKWGKQVNVT